MSFVSKRILVAPLILAGTFWVAACGSSGVAEVSGAAPSEEEVAKPLTWEEFKASAFQDPESGVFYANGDEAFESEKLLREYFDSYVVQGQLAIATRNGVDLKWPDDQKRDLRYCVSTQFGARHAAVVEAMQAAAGAWEEAADLKFVYVASENAACNTANTNVLFDVRPVNSNGQFLAAAFFPGSSRRARSVVIDNSSFQLRGNPTLTGILRHELGHAIGFRHEHTRPGGATSCFEDNSWRGVTQYDSASVMHYPQCGGSANTLALTELDKQGVRSIYGAPTAGTTPTPVPAAPAPAPAPTPTPQPNAFTGSLLRNAIFQPPAFAVRPGTTFTATMSGTGDLDLYVRFNSAPTATTFACRPFLASSNETCRLTVPANATTAHVLVNGFTSGSYDLRVTASQ